MPTWLKVLLIVGGLLLVLIIVAVAGGIYFGKKYLPGLIESSKQSMGEGEEYGRRTDNEGCLSESVSRHKSAEGFGDMLKNSLFLNSCLEHSRETPGFCDAVPRRTDFMKSAQWQMAECKRHGLSMESQCGQLFQQVQQFCERRQRTTGGAGSPSQPPPPAPPANTR